MRIGIGVCARNEEAGIIANLNSIAVSLQNLPQSTEAEFFICLNGCTDGTLPLVRAWLDKNVDIKVHLSSIDQGNLVQAQRTIVEQAKACRITTIIFFDADIVVDPDCISELLKASVPDEVKATYAISIPKERKNQTLVEKVLNLYDLNPTVFTERKHLHGRAFLIKDWNIPETTPALLADDIYLSFHLLQKYGPQSIKRVPMAKVFFNQVARYHDFYQAFRRRKNELAKCLALFPEFKQFPRDQIHRIFLWSKFFKESLYHKYFWTVLFLLKKRARVHFFFATIFNNHSKQLWLPTKTTKSELREPFLILIEGLDCSGKKTVAKNLYEKCIAAGISCTINMGPLSSRVYRYICHVVSMYPFPNFIRSFVYAWDGVGEKNWFSHFHTEVVIQVSSPIRNWAYAYAHKNKLRMAISRIIASQLPKYDQVWYLTVPFDVRLKRHDAQVALGQNADHIQKRFPSKEYFVVMEQHLRFLLQKDTAFIREFNTVDIDGQSIAQIIFDRYQHTKN